MLNTVRKAEKHLQKKDPVIAGLIGRFGPCTLFEQNSLIHRPRFHVLVWAIINQQLSVPSARSIEKKLQSHHRGDCFELNAIAKLSDTKLARCGLSRQKIRYIRALCDAINNKSCDLEALTRADNTTVANTLTRLPGIGPWTADMFLMFSLGRLDVLPLGDLALRKAFSLNYSLPGKPEHKDYLKIAQNWQPYQTIASWYLWASID